MSDRFRHVLVGFTAIVGFIGLGGLLMLFGYVPDWAEGGYVVKVHMSDASGLTPGSRIKLNGLDVGRVVTIELRKPSSLGVVVTTKVKDEYDLPLEVRATVSPTFLGGSPALDLDVKHLADQQQIEMLSRKGDAVIEGATNSLTGELATQLKTALDRPMEQMTRLVDSFETLAADWSSVGRNLKLMTDAITPTDVDGSNGTKVGNVTTVLARADQRLAEMKEVLEGITSLVNDPALRADIKQSLANIKDASVNIKDASAESKELIAKAGTSVEKVDALMDSAKGNIEQLTRRYVAVADDMSGTILAMRKTIDQVREGDGTVGKLINDPSLYNNLNESVKKLDSALVDMKLLIQKWEKEGILKF